jgi:hypothetical protein
VTKLKINRPWTEDEDKRLLAMSAQKRSSLSIALSLKRTRAAIVSRLAKLRAAQATDLEKEQA